MIKLDLADAEGFSRKILIRSKTLGSLWCSAHFDCGKEPSEGRTATRPTMLDPRPHCTHLSSEALRGVTPNAGCPLSWAVPCCFPGCHHLGRGCHPHPQCCHRCAGWHCTPSAFCERDRSFQGPSSACQTDMPPSDVTVKSSGL
jgi:hypothetical protein